MVHGNYIRRDSEFFDCGLNNGKPKVWTVEGFEQDRVYTYDEAMELAGTGIYNWSLLFVLSIAILAMALDMFGFSLVVNNSTCDLNLDHSQTNILLSISMIGAMVMSFPWGYISDTQGRRKALLIATWGSFLFATLSAFSNNWIMLCILKFFSSSLSSGIQSLSYTLLGESCQRVSSSRYLMILTSMLMSALAVYTVIGYFVVKNDFIYDLGLITFTPWRLLTLVLALPLGISALLMLFFYESPKFLLNAGHHDQALELVKLIGKRNGMDMDKFPVKKMVLHEETTSLRGKDTSLMQSLRDQTVPLFKPPLLYRTLQLYYLISIMYSTTNGFITWLPFLAKAFSHAQHTNGMCDMVSYMEDATDSDSGPLCSVSLQSVWIALIQGVVFTILSLLICKVSQWKKTLFITFFLVATASTLIMMNVSDSIVSIVFLFGMLLNCMCMGVVFAYVVDLYPTSYRGMTACLGVMVARLSALIGVSIIGAYITPYCTITFYTWTAYLFSGVIVSMFLPPDKPAKS